MRYGMVINLNRCIGCHTCSVACKACNNLPKGMWWNRVLTVGGEEIDTASGKLPNVQMQFIPVLCQNCDDPPCVKACPTGASYKRKEDGLVLIDADKCIGCRMCMVACPYNARSFNWKEPEYSMDFAVGDHDAPAHQYNTVEKCDRCVNRVARGEQPACVESCPANARIWGDLDDPDSEASRYLQGKNHFKLLEEKGTNPSVFYIK